MDRSTDVLAQRLDADPGILVDRDWKDLDGQEGCEEEDLHLCTV